MPKSRIPSPARSQGIVTPRRYRPIKSTRSVGSPARSHTPARLSSVVQQLREEDSFILSPLPTRRSVLTDNTCIEKPSRKSWWKKMDDNSRDIMEVFDSTKRGNEPNEAVEDLINIEVLSQPREDLTINLPDSSCSDSIDSIVVPQRKLFTQKETNQQNKFGQLIGTRDSTGKVNKTVGLDKSVQGGTKKLFGHPSKLKKKPTFTTALLANSPDRTVSNKTMNITKVLQPTESKVQVRNLFGNRRGTKRKNMFAEFILSESEDEIPDIQARVFEFPKPPEHKRRASSNSRTRKTSPSSSIASDIEIDEWNFLPSSTMVEPEKQIVEDLDFFDVRGAENRLTSNRSTINVQRQSVTLKSVIYERVDERKAISRKENIEDINNDEGHSSKSMLRDKSKHATKRSYDTNNDDQRDDQRDLQDKVEVDDDDNIFDIDQKESRLTRSKSRITVSNENESDKFINKPFGDNNASAHNSTFEGNKTKASKSRSIIKDKSVVHEEIPRQRVANQISVNSVSNKQDGLSKSTQERSKIQQEEHNNIDESKTTPQKVMNRNKSLGLKNDANSSDRKTEKTINNEQTDEESDHHVSQNNLRNENNTIIDNFENSKNNNKSSVLKENSLRNFKNKTHRNDSIGDFDKSASEMPEKRLTRSSISNLSKNASLDVVNKTTSIKTKNFFGSPKNNGSDESDSIEQGANKLKKNNANTKLSKSKEQIEITDPEEERSQHDGANNHQNKSRISFTKNNDSGNFSNKSLEIIQTRKRNTNENKNATVDEIENNINSNNRNDSNEKIKILEKSKEQEKRNDTLTRTQENVTQVVDKETRNEEDQSYYLDERKNDKENGNKYPVISDYIPEPIVDQETNITSNQTRNKHKSIGGRSTDHLSITENAKENANMEDDNQKGNENNPQQERCEGEERIEENNDADNNFDKSHSEEEVDDVIPANTENENQQVDTHLQNIIQGSENEYNQNNIQGDLVRDVLVEKDKSINKSRNQGNNADTKELENKNGSLIPHNLTSPSSDIENNTDDLVDDDENNDSYKEVESEENERTEDDDHSDESQNDEEEPEENTECHDINESQNEEEIVNQELEESETENQEENHSEDNDAESENEEDEGNMTLQYESDQDVEPEIENHSKDETVVDSPEAILCDFAKKNDSFIAQNRNTTGRKTSLIQSQIFRLTAPPARESTGMYSDGVRDSSAEGSGWDSHRTTRKTLRLTLGKDFTPRKSLRTLVMEKSAKRQTQLINETKPTEMNEDDNDKENEMSIGNNVAEYYEESDEKEHEVSKRTRQTTLEMYLMKIQKENMEKRMQIEKQVRSSLNKAPVQNVFKVPAKPALARRTGKSTQNKPPKKSVKSSLIPLDSLPQEVIDDMKYKPPKRFQPSNAPWITKRLYKFLETKLEPRYEYKARVRAEQVVQTLYEFVRAVRRRGEGGAARGGAGGAKWGVRDAGWGGVEGLARELARLRVVRTHADLYQFFHEFMPRDVRVKVNPDVVNKLPLPKNGVFSDILPNDSMQG